MFAAVQPWPASERYGIASQIKRAALSAGANIAEGVAKRGRKDCARHLNIAIGSLAEVAYLLPAAKDVKLLNEEQYGGLLDVQQPAGRMTMGLYRSYRKGIEN